jgi:hypothetical protein
MGKNSRLFEDRGLLESDDIPKALRYARERGRMSWNRSACKGAAKRLGPEASMRRAGWARESKRHDRNARPREQPTRGREMLGRIIFSLPAAATWHK